MTPKIPLIASAPVLVAAVLLAGCTYKDSTVFITTTTIGIDAEAVPTKVTVGYDRTEGSLGPTYQDGQTLPLVGSIDSGSSIFTRENASQAIAAGQAAKLMTKYIVSDAAPPAGATISLAEIEANPTVELSPERRRYFFGTHTHFGLNISFNAATQLPDNIGISWKRKEVAIIPNYAVANNSGEGALYYVPSLLATVERTSEHVDAKDAGFHISQFYATGIAASYLAAQPAIREAMGKKIINDKDTQDALAEKRQTAQTTINDTLAVGTAQKARADTLIDSMVSAGKVSEMVTLGETAGLPLASETAGLAGAALVARVKTICDQSQPAGIAQVTKFNDLMEASLKSQ